MVTTTPACPEPTTPSFRPPSWPCNTPAYRAGRRSHGGLQAAFARELIHHRKLYPASFASCLHDTLILRLQPDYEPEDVGAKTVGRFLKKAAEFVSKVGEVTA
jgi:hypothetical protein